MSLAFVKGIHQWPVNSPYKGPVPRKMFPLDDVIMYYLSKTVFKFPRANRFKVHRVPLLNIQELFTLNQQWNLYILTGVPDMVHRETPATFGLQYNNFHQHDDVIKCKHFPRYWPFVPRIHQSPVNSPQKGQWHGALMLSLICTWTNGWDAGDLGRHCANYDVTVMELYIQGIIWQ